MLSYRDKIADIDRLIEAERFQWNQGGVPHLLPFDDLAQIFRLHIYKQFPKWDQAREFDPWCATVINNQRINQIRNHYGRFTPPCIKGRGGCQFNLGDGGCQFTQSGKQDSGCPAYAAWEKSKKGAYQLRTAAPLEDYDGATTEGTSDIVESVEKFHKRMKSALSERLYRAYTYFYIEHLPDLEVAKLLGFKTKEKNRCPGYRQISNMKAEIFKVAKELVTQFDW